jgi:TRAP-type C4-dicarboxylate transport system substrate-binding protein
MAKGINIIALAGAPGAAALMAGDAAAEDLRLSHWVPAQHPLQPTGLEPWAQSIAEASDGRLTIAIFRRSSSAPRPTTTTWRATASPTSPT